MKKLPKIYQNDITKKIKNNKSICICIEGKSKYHPKENKIEEIKTSEQIDETLNKIFSGIGYSYNIPVIIEYSDKKVETSLIAKTNNNIVTLENEIIPITDIKTIKIKD